MDGELDLTKIVFFTFIILLGLIQWADQKTELSRRNKLALFLSGLGSIALVLTIYDRKNAIKHENRDHHHPSILFLSQPSSTLPTKEDKNLKDPPGISTTVPL